MKCFLLFRCNGSAPEEGPVRIAQHIPSGVDVVRELELYPTLFKEVEKLAKLEVVETYWSSD
jgi:hypothetical protein